MSPADLYIRFLSLESLSHERHAHLTSLLDEAEHTRAARFAMATSRREYQAAHGLLRETVAEVSGTDPRRLAFAAPHQGGKPSLVAPPGGITDINLSHTAGLVACAVAIGGTVGIDVEHLGRRSDPAIAHRFFAADEAAWVAAHPPAGRKAAFLAVWTLKEAFVKAMGLGLGMDLSSFSVRPDPARLLIAPTEAGPLSAWRLWQWAAGPHHLAAVAVRLPANAPEPRLDLRMVG